MKIFPLYLLLLVQNVSFTKGSTLSLWESRAEILASEMRKLCTPTMSKPKENTYGMNGSFPATGVLLHLSLSRLFRLTGLCALTRKHDNCTVQRYESDLISKNPSIQTFIYQHGFLTKTKRGIVRLNDHKRWTKTNPQINQKKTHEVTNFFFTVSST